MDERDTLFGGPTVETAYVPSGKGTVVGTVLMIVGGLMGAPFAAALVHFIGGGLAKLVSELSALFGLVMWFAMFTVFPAFGGMGIGWFVSEGAIIGKSRNGSGAGAISLLSSVFSIAVYAYLRFLRYGEDAFDSLWDYGKTAIIFICLALMAWISAVQGIAAKPFCEACQCYMDIRKSKRISRGQQVDAAGSVRAGKLEELSSLFVGLDHGGDQYAVLEIHACPKCGEQGFLEIRSFVTERKSDRRGTETTTTTDRLVFSVPIGKDAIEALEAMHRCGTGV